MIELIYPAVESPSLWPVVLDGIASPDRTVGCKRSCQMLCLLVKASAPVPELISCLVADPVRIPTSAENPADTASRP